MSKILITGATGKLGSGVIFHLLQKTTVDRIVALVKNKTKSDELLIKGIEIRYGNYNDIASLDAAMKGISKVLLISGNDQTRRLTQHKHVINAAKNNGVKFIAYTGISIKCVKSCQTNDFMNSHFATEDYLRASGLGYVILRNTLYADDLPYYIGRRETFSENGIVFHAGTGRVPYVLRDEMAEAFANLLLQQEHENCVYEIGNSKAFTFAEIARELSVLMGKVIPYIGNDPERYAAAVKKMSLPEHVATFLICTSEDIRNGQYDITTGDLERLLVRKPADLPAILKKVYDLNDK